MSILDYARHRLESFLEEVGRLKECEFPYLHSRDLLEQLGQLFQQKLDRLSGFHATSDPDLVKHECGLALHALFSYVPLLGFALRSTNVRNAFELFGPLLRLARQVLEPPDLRHLRKTRLVLSSEWDYSPFVYRDVPGLPDFVMIGFPAPESANPLLVPLAGHELGHSVWVKQALEDAVRPKVKQQVVAIIATRWKEYRQVFPSVGDDPNELTKDLYALETWGPVVEWAMRQAEESFCDFVGLRIFGSSFLHAFAYLLSPKAGPRSVLYPNLRMRVGDLQKAATNFKIAVPDGYDSMFEDDAVISLPASEEF